MFVCIYYLAYLAYHDESNDSLISFLYLFLDITLGIVISLTKVFFGLSKPMLEALVVALQSQIYDSICFTLAAFILWPLFWILASLIFNLIAVLRGLVHFLLQKEIIYAVMFIGFYLGQNVLTVNFGKIMKLMYNLLEYPWLFLLDLLFLIKQYFGYFIKVLDETLVYSICEKFTEFYQWLSNRYIVAVNDGTWDWFIYDVFYFPFSIILFFFMWPIAIKYLRRVVFLFCCFLSAYFSSRFYIIEDPTRYTRCYCSELVYEAWAELIYNYQNFTDKHAFYYTILIVFIFLLMCPVYTLMGLAQLSFVIGDLGVDFFFFVKDEIYFFTKHINYWTYSVLFIRYAILSMFAEAQSEHRLLYLRRRLIKLRCKYPNYYYNKIEFPLFFFDVVLFYWLFTNTLFLSVVFCWAGLFFLIKICNNFALGYLFLIFLGIPTALMLIFAVVFSYLSFIYPGDLIEDFGDVEW